jgi:hypothetical protein
MDDSTAWFRKKKQVPKQRRGYLFRFLTAKIIRAAMARIDIIVLTGVNRDVDISISWDI